MLSASARHPENIQQVVEERILPRLPKQPTLLDVGAGSGKVAERLAPHFSSLTLLEPNQNQIAGFKLEKAKILLEPLEHDHSPERYELVVCSHVLYHVPLSEWGAFIDRLLSFVRPGGACVIVMAAARGPTYELCRDFSETMLFDEQLLTTMQHKRLPHEVLPWPEPRGCTSARKQGMSSEHEAHPDQSPPGRPRRLGTVLSGARHRAAAGGA